MRRPCEMPFKPAYLKLGIEEIKNRARKALELLSPCRLCPRRCGAKRLEGETGFCGIGRLAKVASYGPHHGEERPLSGRCGSGTIFFGGCNLRCSFCQNHDISQRPAGREADAEDLASIMLALQSMGCHNINLVTPTHVVPQILEALTLVTQRGLSLPLVYNSGGYDSIEALELLDGIVDIYMPDMKYAARGVARALSGAEDYPEVNRAAVKEMHRQVGDLELDEKGLARRGLLVRHLVLPNNLAGTEEIAEFLAKEVSPRTFLNVMDQYYPTYKAFDHPEIARRITIVEFEAAVKAALDAGLTRLYGTHQR
jgi:putative pyruvate formate lyase activating enzyme